jgi:hypothetical protein
MRYQIWLISVLFCVFFTGCSNILEKPESQYDQAGNVSVQIQMGQGAARTLLPVVPFVRYELAFTAEGQETLTRTLTGGVSSVVLELPKATWTVTAEAFLEAEETPAAQGSAELKVLSNKRETIVIPLVMSPGDGAGSFSYNISLPPDAKTATLTLGSLAEGDSANTETKDLLASAGSGSGTITGKAAGYYLVTLDIECGGQIFLKRHASRTEAAHIYEGRTTEFTVPAGELAFNYSPAPGLYFDHGRRITDADTPATQAAWEERNTYYVPSGAEVVLAPVSANVPSGTITYEWKTKIGAAAETLESETGEYFTASFTADTLVKVALKMDAVSAATASVMVRPVAVPPARSGGAKAQVTKVIEFSPAPGQFVGRGNGYSNPSISGLASLSEEQVRQIVQDHIDGKITFNNQSVDGKVFSLGGWGGYYIMHFDHSVVNDSGPDIEIRSNNHVAGMPEPGVVWVSQDLNGDGEPNEIWYQLAGAGTGTHRRRYGIVWFKPRDGLAFWMDTQGENGTFLNLGANNGYPYHITGPAGTWVLFTGTLLSHEDPQSLSGYVDTSTTTFDIAGAVDEKGDPVTLQYIDFVRVQTGFNKNEGGGLGENSTEAGIPRDLHF